MERINTAEALDERGMGGRQDRGGPGSVEPQAALLRKGQALQAARSHLVAKDPNFDSAQGLFQIAVVVASVSTITKLRLLLVGAAGLGTVALLLLLNALVLFVHLPD